MDVDTGWVTRPIFVSSTFRDMQAERDHLVDFVLPRLQEEARRLRIHLELVDLRQGVETAHLGTEDEAEKELHILKVCLAEIDRSRPFFIGLVGDRYGTIPATERADATVQELGIDDIEFRGMSVTAMEIEYALARERPDQRRRCFFYFRELEFPKDSASSARAIYRDRDATDPMAAVRANAVEALKIRLKADPRLEGRRFTYRWKLPPDSEHGDCVAAFGDLVTDHILRELEDEATIIEGERAIGSWNREDEALDEYIERQRLQYVPRREEMRILRLHALGQADSYDNRAMCLTGSPGSGKSTLLMNCVEGLLKEPTTLVLTAVVGLTPAFSRPDGILAYWARRLEEFLGETGQASDGDFDSVRDRFESLLYRAARQVRIVIVLDAVNQFGDDEQARQLTWLPHEWPGNVRMIVSMLPGRDAVALSSLHGFREQPLAALSQDAAQRLCEKIWGRYHHELNPSAVSALLGRRTVEGSPSYENPLWLRLAAESVNLLDADDFARADVAFSGAPPEHRLQFLILSTAENLPGDLPDLYEWMLSRADSRFEPKLVSAFAIAINVSRFGWRESDLMNLIPLVADAVFGDKVPNHETGRIRIDRLRLAELRRFFRGQIDRFGSSELWNFTHTQFGLAVRRHCLLDKGALEVLRREAPQLTRDARESAAFNSAGLRAAHEAIDDYLNQLPEDDPIRHSESLYHCWHAVRHEEFAALLASGLSHAQTSLAADLIVAGLLAPIPSMPERGRIRFGHIFVDAGLTLERSLEISRFVRSALLARMTNSAPYSLRASVVEETAQMLEWVRKRSAPGRDADVEEFRLQVAEADVFAEGRELGRARMLHRRALEQLERILSQSGFSDDLLADLCRILARVAEHDRDGGYFEGAAKHLERRMLVADGLLERNPGNLEYGLEKAAVQADIAALNAAQKVYPLAALYQQFALDVLDDMRANGIGSDKLAKAVGHCELRLGDYLKKAGDLNTAWARLKSAETNLRGALNDSPTDVALILDLAEAESELASLASAQGRIEQFRQFTSDALTRRRQVYENYPYSLRSALALSDSYLDISDGAAADGEPSIALEAIENALNLVDDARARFPQDDSLSERASALKGAAERLGLNRR